MGLYNQTPEVPGLLLSSMALRLLQLSRGFHIHYMDLSYQNCEEGPCVVLWCDPSSFLSSPALL